MFSAFSFDRRVLVIDDQQAVHDAYRSVLMPKRRNTQALDAMECELFGGSTLATEQEHEFQVSFAFQGEEGLELVQQACKLGKEFGIAFVDTDR